jgi:hypothetical protein
LGGTAPPGTSGLSCTFHWECLNGGVCWRERCRCVYPWHGSYCQQVKDCVCDFSIS